MTITTMSSTEFDQDIAGAKKAAGEGPVIITDHDRPAHVLLTIEEYRKLGGPQPTLADLLAQEEGGDIDFDPPKLQGPLFRPADFD